MKDADKIAIDLYNAGESACGTLHVGAPLRSDSGPGCTDAIVSYRHEEFARITIAPHNDKERRFTIDVNLGVDEDERVCSFATAVFKSVDVAAGFLIGLAQCE